MEWDFAPVLLGFPGCRRQACFLTDPGKLEFFSEHFSKAELLLNGVERFNTILLVIHVFILITINFYVLLYAIFNYKLLRSGIA